MYGGIQRIVTLMYHHYMAGIFPIHRKTQNIQSIYNDVMKCTVIFKRYSQCCPFVSTVMMPVYQHNRFYSLYFIIFLLIGMAFWYFCEFFIISQELS